MHQPHRSVIIQQPRYAKHYCRKRFAATNALVSFFLANNLPYVSYFFICRCKYIHRNIGILPAPVF
jgi:hypothetical protein